MKVGALFFVACFFVVSINAASWTNGRGSAGGYNFGHYTYLPDSYNVSNTDKHPVILTLHGLGESGDGNIPKIYWLFNASIPRYINKTLWPASWNFVVVAPQDFNGWWNEYRITNVINWLFNKYPKADVNRLYITGYSSGGGGVWEYVLAGNTQARRVAAIAPVCGNGGFPTPNVSTIVSNNVPVWAFHNNGDQTVDVGITNRFIDALNNGGINPPAQKTIYTANSHDAWTAAHNPATSPVYAWFLTHSRATTTPTPTTPAPTTPSPSACPTPSIGSGVGLRGIYYSGKNFEDAIGARVDGSIDFSWGSTGIPTLPSSNFSVRWTGTLLAKLSGAHSFYTTSDDGVRLTIGGSSIIDNWTDHAAVENSGTLALTAGSTYAVVLEFYNAAPGATISLSWSAACLPKEIIPSAQFTPAPLNIC